MSRSPEPAAPSRWRGSLGAALIAAALVVPIAGAPAAAVDASPVATAAPLTRAAALEAAIPAEIAGLAITTVAFDGDDIVADASPDDPISELVELAVARGVTISELAIASGSGGDETRFVGILGARLGQLPASEWASALTPVILELGEGVDLRVDVIAGRDVVRVGPGSGLTGERPVVVVESGDTVWYVVTDDTLLEEVIGSLP